MTRPLRKKGVAASIGIGVGPACVVLPGRRASSYRSISEEELEAELLRFTTAVEASKAEIQRSKQDLTDRHGEEYAPILDVHLLMHGDALLIDAISSAIEEDGINAEWAVARVVEKLKAPLLKNNSSYFRERARDVDHVKEHLLRHLHGEVPSHATITEPVVLVARDLTPADAVHLLAPPVVALVTETGGATSHTAILARAFGVPAVVGVGKLANELEAGESVLVDGFAGDVTVGPSQEEEDEAQARGKRFSTLVDSAAQGGATTIDGVEIQIAANVELPSEVESAVAQGAEGVGLYRTEFISLNRTQPPEEAEQVELYTRVVSAMHPHRVVFRTFDWRGDKRLDAQDWGSNDRHWLKTQVRAILQASVSGSVGLMFPMVGTVDQFLHDQALVHECRVELVGEGVQIGEVPIGMMVEVPSAALLAERFAAEADFFSVGTNDLVQYTLALDRGRPLTSTSGQPLDPAVLRLLDQTSRAATRADIPVSVCGDMACDSISIVLALGLGYRSLSVPASVLALTRALVQRIDTTQAIEVAQQALQCTSATEVRSLIIERFEVQLGPVWREQGII